jgi:general secretion pathway protein D
MGEVLKISYIIDPKVKGVVNIHTSGQISADDIFPVFQSILVLNGATAVKKGQLYEIVPFGDAKKLYTLPSKSDDPGKTLAEEKYVIQIIPLKFIPVTEGSKLIKPFLSDGADIIEHPSQNILLVGDIASNIRKVLDLIGLFDVDLFSDLKVRIYPVYNSDVTEIAKEIERIFASFEVSTKSGRGVGITFTPVTRINSLLVVSSIPNIFEKVEAWLKQLDQTPASDAKLGVFVYYVQNGKAKDLAEVLKQVFTATKPKTTTASTAPTTGATPSTAPATPPGQRGARPTPPAAPGAPGAPTASEEGGVPTGEINIVVDETTNALIVRAFPRDYKYVLETIKKLDLYPKQVLIEVFLASVTLDDTTKFGLEFSVFQDTFTKNGTLYKWALGMGGLASTGLSDLVAGASSFASGIRYAIAATDKLTAAVNALANDNKAQIIASPHLLASNNKEAKIQIGTSQPILTNTYSTTATGVATATIEGSIEYKDIGIIITVTPRISDGGLVTMEISVENSDVSQTSLGSLTNVPVFSKKIAKTTLSIVDAQTIVIGGLIQESKTTGSSGVPFLSRIPVLGALFGYQNYQKNRQELMLLLTPRVITDIDQSNSITREFKQKLDSLRRDVDIRVK